ncbi:hypothetical protein PILCRDRAFT_820757 [Piloderma croceum F 1598]|uniref:Stress-response A/B barrel domain-containing protein n=1 Tax=Piloderma croceum (strain F 1598) TaxID=765440 RepID=A0A0C3FRI6_PILCF|nr:hypothetical protein PILCRDRAFT_820757 [Piloderma croceum F 1598]
MPPITRFAAFKYKQGTTGQQKRAWFDGLVSLYAANADRVNFAPKVGCNHNPQGYGKEFDVMFTVEFKSEQDRDGFMADPRHNEYRASIKDIVEDIIFYDFVAVDYADFC